MGNLSKIFKPAGLNYVDEELVKDVARIIEWQQILKEVNIDGVEPMYNTLGESAKYISNDDVVVRENADIFANAAEKDALVAAGWTDEGVAWQVQPNVGAPVYRIFDKAKGMHIFTADAVERDACITAGAVDEGIAWYGHDKGRAVYKITNPKVNKVLYTTSAAEKDALAATGFTVEEANFKVN